MAGEQALGKRATDWYVRNAGKIGALYCIVPTLAWFGLMMLSYDFRDVYALRLAVALIVGGCVASGVNRFGLELWIAKHRSPKGPAGLLDGARVGAGIGFGCAVIAPLTLLISSTHLEEAKTLIIASWLVAPACGALIGVVLAAIGRTNIAREWESAPEAGK